MDKRDRAELFRVRLDAAMRRRDVSRSALARETNVDRSTIGQLLAPEHTRLPNAQLAADVAETLGVSSDWLLGLTDRPERPADIVDAAVAMAEAKRTLADEKILQWHREAAGYKVRHVPATLPDLLKTEDVLRWEYAESIGRSPEQAVAASRDRIDMMQTTGSDYEIALPLHEIQSFAAGLGYYDGLDPAIRRAQLIHLATRCDALFPALRLFLFDARQVFSAPITVFGPLLAVIYVGRFYLAFRESARVRALAGQFDWLVREARIDARNAAGYFRALASEVEHGAR